MLSSNPAVPNIGYCAAHPPASKAGRQISQKSGGGAVSQERMRDRGYSLALVMRAPKGMSFSSMRS